MLNPMGIEISFLIKKLSADNNLQNREFIHGYKFALSIFGDPFLLNNLVIAIGRNKKEFQKKIFKPLN